MDAGRASQEGRGLFALLDAAASNGWLIGTPLEARWEEVRRQVIAGECYDARAVDMVELLEALEASGSLAGTWIGDRWRSIRARIAVCD